MHLRYTGEGLWIHLTSYGIHRRALVNMAVNLGSHIVVCDGVYSGRRLPAFQRNMLLPFSVLNIHLGHYSKSNMVKNHQVSCKQECLYSLATVSSSRRRVPYSQAQPSAC
jgi:hypothetical protein